MQWGNDLLGATREQCFVNRAVDRLLIVATIFVIGALIGASVFGN